MEQDISQWLPAKRRKNRKPLTLELVRSFGQQPALIHFLVLRTLRDRTATDQTGTYLSTPAIFVAFAALAFPATTASWTSNVLANAIVSFAVVLLILIGMLPILWQVAQGIVGRDIALVWLAAYEDELARQRSMPGLRGRRWRRAH